MEQTVTRVRCGLLETYPALGNAPFRLYRGGQVISLTGLWMQNLAQGWLIPELTDSPLLLGLVGAFWAAPNILLSLSLLLLALVGLAGSIYSTLISTMLQQSLDDDYRGRVMGVFSLVMNTVAFAGLQAGAVASAFGVSTALAFNGVMVIAAGAFVLAFVARFRSA